MLIARRVRQPMLIYYMLSPKNTGALPSSTLMGEPVEERPARDREGSYFEVQAAESSPAMLSRDLLYYIFGSKDVEPGKRPAYELTRRQKVCVKDIWTNIKEFVQYKHLRRYFPIQLAGPEAASSAPQDRDGSPSSGGQAAALSIAQQVQLQLDTKLAASDGTTSRPGPQHFTQVSPWLEMTQWPRYLKGQDLLPAA
ncbi:hypothetical protein V8E51_012840 [Hyaloscypha variabilis]